MIKMENGLDKKNGLRPKTHGLIVHSGGKNRLKKSGSSFESFNDEYELEDSPLSFFEKMTIGTLNSHRSFNAVDHFYSIQEDDSLTKSPQAYKTSSNGGGGGNGMEQRIERLEAKTDKIQGELNTISKSIAVMEEVQKNLATKTDIQDIKNLATKTDIQDIKNEILRAVHQIPSDEKIKQIISDSIKEEEIASKVFVKSEISSLLNKLLMWIAGIAITTGGLVVTILRLILK